jgi:hypothetical protein
MSGPDKESDTPKSEKKAEQDFSHGPVAARAQPVHYYQPEGDHRHEQGGNPRGHDLFRPADAAIPH